MKTQRVSLYIGVLLITLGISALAYAQSCGQTVTGTVTLAADLTCPTGHGLRVGTGAVLDCAGHTITGGNQAEQYGIYVRNVSNATVRNCTVQRFEIGIRLRTAINATIQNNLLRDNTRYGMEITELSTGALIQGNSIESNGDEGIHVSGPVDRDAAHRIIENTLDGNGVEGIYLLSSHANTIADNEIRNHGTAGIYVKSSNRNAIERNTLTNDALQLVSGSQLNVLRDNTIIGSYLKFTGASSNSVSSMSIEGENGKPAQAYDFNNSKNNQIVDSEATNPADYHIRATNGSTGNVFTRFLAIPTLRCSVDKQSSVTVTDPAGKSLSCPSK